ncbi:hypothetical protein [Streptomyces viridochromogenes]|uniref:Lipoprotein n=1 Tax=Streptomyces viridochromogenes Tue57 TaxID=1160705 RepID=L8P310_STRVR|nr:hypothetical protein [Streptomyces viridochromogenes]ELS50865.1 hypothetical protein STVIR_8173 [Streptomyces viridochromogenes Tue57]
MYVMEKRRPGRRATALLFAFALGAAGLVGCGDDTAGSDAGADVQEVQEDAFWRDTDRWVGEQVTVSAEVSEVVNEDAFTIAGTEDPDVDELLVVSADTTGVEEGDLAKVTGTVKENFNPADAEEDLGADWENEIFADWVNEHYIQASSVDIDTRQN